MGITPRHSLAIALTSYQKCCQEPFASTPVQIIYGFARLRFIWISLSCKLRLMLMIAPASEVAYSLLSIKERVG